MLLLHGLCSLLRVLLSLIMDKDPALFLKTANYHREFSYPLIPDLDWDASLYQAGFFSSGEKADMSLFHSLSIGEKAQACDGFESRRIREMARRIMDRNYGGASHALSQGFLTHMERLAGNLPGEAVRGYKNDTKYTCEEALEELAEIRSQGETDFEPVQIEILDWLEGYIPGLLSSFADPL